jgi:hypothetical protein
MTAKSTIPSSTLPPGTTEWVEDVQQKMLAEFNARYAATTVGGHVGKPIIVEFDDHGNIRTRYTPKDWLQAREITDNPVVPIKRNDGTIIYKSAAMWWLKHPEHRWYRRIMLAPPGSEQALDETARDLNLWNGFRVDPDDSASCQRNLDHVAEVICDGDEDLFEWLINWCAALVQNPGKPGMSAPVLVGGQGAGKGHFVLGMLGALFHEHHVVHLRNGGELTGSFNEHLSQKIVCYADEAFWGDRASANMLKGLITERTIPIHPKFLPRYEEPSCLHVVIASNADRPMPIERDDRRFAIFRVSERFKNDQNYFGALRAELASGGVGALLNLLLYYDVNDNLLRTPPANSEKATMKLESLSVLDRFWLSYLTERTEWTPQQKGPNDTGRIGRDDLHAAMVTWHEKLRYAGPYPSKEVLGSFLARHFKNGGMSGWPRATKTKDLKNAWSFPSITVCREVFLRATGTSPFAMTGVSDWARLLESPTIH